MATKKRDLGGRPRLPAKDRLSVRLHTAVTEDQETKILKAAQRAGLGVSDWLRGIALEKVG